MISWEYGVSNISVDPTRCLVLTWKLDAGADFEQFSSHFGWIIVRLPHELFFITISHSSMVWCMWCHERWPTTAPQTYNMIHVNSISDLVLENLTLKCCNLFICWPKYFKFLETFYWIVFNSAAKFHLFIVTDKEDINDNMTVTQCQWNIWLGRSCPAADMGLWNILVHPSGGLAITGKKVRQPILSYFQHISSEYREITSLTPINYCF